MVDSATTALHNGACTCQCISKRMHYKIPFSHKGCMRSLEFYENYITLSCLENNKLLRYYMVNAWVMHGILPKVVELTI
jgi:hypothetical protein